MGDVLLGVVRVLVVAVLLGVAAAALGVLFWLTFRIVRSVLTGRWERMD